MPFIFVCVDRANVGLLQFLKDLDRSFDVIITCPETAQYGYMLAKNLKATAVLQTTDLNKRQSYETNEDVRLRIETFLESIRSMSFQIAIIVSFADNYNTWNPLTICNEDWGIGPM
jgi:hypothetical protein